MDISLDEELDLEYDSMSPEERNAFLGASDSDIDWITGLDDMEHVYTLSALEDYCVEDFNSEAERRIAAIMEMFKKHAAENNFDLKDQGMGVFSINHKCMPRPVTGAVYTDHIDFNLDEIVSTRAPFKALVSWIEKEGKKKMAQQKEE